MRYLLAAVLVILVIVGGWYYVTKHAALPASPPPATGGTTPVTATSTYANATPDSIVIESPKPGGTVASVVSASGVARGTWYFEGTFPIVIADKDGAVIGQGVADAEGEWTTENLVPWSAVVTLTKPYTGAATIVFKKDNPSGDPARDASVSVPVTIE